MGEGAGAGSARCRRVDGAGVGLAVTEVGDPEAPTVVLVHGYPDTSALWEPVTDRLADRYHVVSYDVRGAGRSDAPAEGRDGYALDRLVADLAAVADATSPHRPVHLVGHDWGSIQGWEAVTTERMAGRVASFTSISGPSLAHVDWWIRSRLGRPRGARQLVAQGLRSWYITAFRLPGAPELWRRGGATLVTRALRRMGEWPEGTGPAPTLADDAARGVDLYRANMDRRPSRPSRAHRGGDRPPDRRTDVPVQLIVPRGDPWVTPALAHGVERTAPTLWRRHVAGGHWLPRTRPGLLAGWIVELVDHVEGAPEPPGLGRHRVGGHRSRDEGRVVVVTGAGSGIGRHAALAFAERGAHVVAVDIDATAAARTATLCGDLGAPARAHEVDVGDADAMEQLARQVGDDHGAADVLVNNAGIAVVGRFLDTSLEDWERLLRVNLGGVIHGSLLLGGQMVARGEGGHIVNVASAAAFAPSRAYPAYATSKAAVLMLSECLRAELAGEGIGVSAICPGVVDTGIVGAARFVGLDGPEAERRRSRASRFYARRAFTPDRVADAVVRAVERDRAVVPVTPEAAVARLLARLSPGLSRRLARIDPTGRL